MSDRNLRYSNTIELLELKYGKPLYDLLYDDYCIQGLSIRALAKKYHVSIVTVCKYIKQLSIPKHIINLGGNEDDQSNQSITRNNEQV